MSASGRLRVLHDEFQEVAQGNLVEVVPSDPRVGDRVRYVYPAEVAAEKRRVGGSLIAALPELTAVVEAAERAERKLWLEYREVEEAVNRFGDDVPEHESWAEGEALRDALAALDAKMVNE